MRSITTRTEEEEDGDALEGDRQQEFTLLMFSYIILNSLCICCAYAQTL